MRAARRAARAAAAAEVTRVGFAPIVRVDEERREIELCATSEAVDTHGTIFSYEASRDAFDRWAGNVREMHDRKAVGRGAAGLHYRDVDRPARHLWHGSLDGERQYREDLCGRLEQCADVGRHHPAGAAEHLRGQRCDAWRAGDAAPAAPSGILALSDVDSLLATMYLQAAGDPDYLIMNPLDNIKLAESGFRPPQAAGLQPRR
jgi:hypothetical protein